MSDWTESPTVQAMLESEQPGNIAGMVDHSKLNGNGFDLETFIRTHNIEVTGTSSYKGGTRWGLPECPFNSAHKAPDAAIFRDANGRLGFECRHASCQQYHWRDFRLKFDPTAYQPKSNGTPRNGSASPAQPLVSTSPRTLRQLSIDCPKLNEPLIDGLLRKAELANIVSETKLGKSWLMLYTTITCVGGGMLFGRYRTTPGKVLYLDNELHGGTIANRAFRVGEAMGLTPDAYQDSLHYEVLRGRRIDIHQLGKYLEQFKAGDFTYVVLDALYRAWPNGQSENENAAWIDVMNAMEAYAERLQVAWLTVHHSTKGVQADKRVTDVGAGGGAQSRAADAHIVLRQHEQPGVTVVDAALRSFKPIDPFCLRWNFPLWEPADDCDPMALKTNRPPVKAKAADATGKPNRFDDQCKAAMEHFAKEPMTLSGLKRTMSISGATAKEVITALLESNEIESALVGKWEGYQITQSGSGTTRTED